MYQSRFLPTLLCVLMGLSGCQATPDSGMFGNNGYLQLWVGDVIVFEYAVPAGGMHCHRNAIFNNRELDASSGAAYRCANQPASTTALPYSFVSISTLNHLQGFRDSNAATHRYATRESCWEAVMELPKDSQKLVSENCRANEPQERVRAGENKA
jgi:hypothetical protein